MKPKVLYRILLVLVMLVLFALGLCFIGVALNFITADTVNAIAALPYASAINGWITAGVGLLLCLIAIVLIIGFNRRAPKNQAPASAVISQNEMGISSITLAAIDDMVKRHCATANGNVKKCDSRIAVVENKLKIDLRSCNSRGSQYSRDYRSPQDQPYRLHTDNYRHTGERRQHSCLN